MSKTVHPYAHRLGILRDWHSRWFARRTQYRDFLKADTIVRQHIEKRLKGYYVDSIEVERGQNFMKVIVKSSRPGMVIGRSGEGALRLKEEIVQVMRRNHLAVPQELRLDVEEIKSPESHAAIVAQMVIEGLEKRLPFRRVLKTTLDKVMANRDVKGCKISLSGRLGGAEMGRHESGLRGSLPLQTLRSDIDFARAAAKLSYGLIGVKVWIYRGEVFEK